MKDSLPFPLRLDLFENGKEVAALSQRVVQRAVSWLMTLCWSKNFDQEALWSALNIFHAYRVRYEVHKEDLELARKW